MAKTGRPRKPSIIKFNAGERRKERLNPDEPKPELCIPKAPKHLRGEALAEWNRITVELDKIGLLSECDRAGLAAYCVVYARWVTAEEALAEMNSGESPTEGYVSISKNGMEFQSPLLGVANTALGLMHKYLVEFGLTPASRTRVKAPQKNDAKNRWGDLTPETKKVM